jgi:serine/threonine protein kinase
MLSVDQELKAGQIIGHYQILSTLGKGGMGEVYLAHDKKLDRQIALKFLPHIFTQNKERLHRFEREARAASALNHPNILTIHEIGESDNHRFIAMEFVDGETLRQKISAGPLRVHEALNIAEQIASALAAANSAGIIHRDIKPENTMLRHDGYVKILDFGLAKLVEQKPRGPEDSTQALLKTSAGVVMGTANYMSPEQARGLPVDSRTDIWSLGVVLYEMLSGHPPFAGATTSDLLVAILEHEPQPLTRLSHLPDTLEWIVTKALTKERDDRYQTARELLTDLRRLKQRLSVSVEVERSIAPEFGRNSSTSRTDTPKFGPLGLIRNWKWAAALAMIIALAAIVIAWKSPAWLSRGSKTGLPVVMLMDSPLPDRVYDPETRKNGGTNADDITDFLRDLPVVLEKENTSPLWHREDQVLREHPTLIVMHKSCFADSTLGFDPQSTATQTADSKVESFLGYISLGDPATKFLVYTRRADDHGAWAAELVKRFPNLSSRIVTITIPGGPEHATFRNPDTQKMVKQQVQAILGLR